MKPLQDVREGVVERTRPAMRQTDCVADQATAVCDALRQGAPRGAWRVQGGELAAVCEEARNLECGIGGIIVGPAGGTCCAVPAMGAVRTPEALYAAQGTHCGNAADFSMSRQL